MQTKSIFLSKTFWFNILSFLLSICVLVDPSFLTGLGVAPESQVKVLAGIAAFVAIVNKVLRMFFTDSPVTLMGGQQIVPVILLCAMLGFSGCSFTQNAQSYLEKHCPKSYATNPLTGNLEIHYQCDSLWHSTALNDKCENVSICIDALTGSVSGDVECAGLVNVPKLIGSAKKR